MFVDLDAREVKLAKYPDVTVELRSLDVADFQRASTAWAVLGGELQSAPPEQLERFLSVIGELVPKYIVAVRGLEVRDKGEARPATGADLVTKAVLYPIAIEVFGRLLEGAQLTEVEAKK